MSKSNAKKRIPLKPAHESLEKLLKELETVDLDDLQPRLRPGTSVLATPDSASWLAALAHARDSLFEWCGSPVQGASQFFVEAPSKRR